MNQCGFSVIDAIFEEIEESASSQSQSKHEVKADLGMGSCHNNQPTRGLQQC